MFISADYLSINYGIDNAIARFFVDREPPADNLYWKGKLLYLRPTPGYLFIPLIVDLLSRVGISKQELLSEAFVGTMERIGHISALEETKQITTAEAVHQCKMLVKGSCMNEEWYAAICNYFDGVEGNMIGSLVTPFKALHRGDVFLFSLCSVQLPSGLMKQIAETWFALISTLLLLDDAEDIKHDKEHGDENAFLESGLTPEGIEDIKQLLSKSLRIIASLNQSMANQLDKKFKELAQRPDVKKLMEA